jgi:RHS repeat-associated protein
VGTAIPTATGSATPTVTATVTATTTCSAIDYTYDNNGNLTTESRCGAATTYTYDSDNRLTSVVAGGVTTSMVYDYDGNLVQKTVGGVVTRYVYAGGPAPIVEINVTAGTTKDFIQANGRTWGVMEATSNTYFHHDAIGSVVALSNDGGQVTDTYEYEPFGKVLQHQGTSTNDYQFVGGYGVRKLNDTLDTMGVRQYSETVGRFTTQDPLGMKGGLNYYKYAQNNSLKLMDANGLCPCPAGGQLFYLPGAPLFCAPSGTNWTFIWAVGLANTLDVYAIGKYVGHNGAFDFQRYGGFTKEYVAASNVAVGVYMQGAQFSLSETLTIATSFAEISGSNADQTDSPLYWGYGYTNAAHGIFPVPYNN